MLHGELVQRGVQDALYGLSDALKATVVGKVRTLRRVGSGGQGAGLDVMDIFF